MWHFSQKFQIYMKHFILAPFSKERYRISSNNTWGYHYYSNASNDRKSIKLMHAIIRIVGIIRITDIIRIAGIILGRVFFEEKWWSVHL